MPSLVCIISPAKSLAPNIGMLLPVAQSFPGFLERTELLVAQLRGVKAAEFKKMMSVSDVIAARTREEYQFFEFQHASSSSSSSGQVPPAVFTQAGLLFDGPAYRGLCCAALSPADMQVCQQSVRFLSGLYGCLRPGDFIQSHRLEMGTRGLPLPHGASTLYQYWAAQLVDSLLADLKPQSGAYPGMLLNCASEEYFKVIDKAALAASGRRVKIVTCTFTDKGRVLSVYAKRARGLMARFVSTDAALRAAMAAASAKGGDSGAEGALLSALQAFNLEGYAFKSMSEDSKSGEVTLQFDRGAVPIPSNPVPRAAAGSAVATLAAAAPAAPATGAGKSAGKKGIKRSVEAEADADTEAGTQDAAACKSKGKGKGKGKKRRA